VIFNIPIDRDAKITCFLDFKILDGHADLGYPL
jgi:hypothetical protein